MSFVLSRNDVSEPSKYALKDRVVQIIGRGSLRDCNDPRISREHASVTTKGETLILRSLHLKPCFYRKSFSDTMNKLSIGESVELFHGDHFGLLPEKNWYELIYIKEEDSDDNKNKAEAQNKNIQEDPNKTKNPDQSPTKRPHTPDQHPGAKKIKTEPESPIKEGTEPEYPVRKVGETEGAEKNSNDRNQQASTSNEEEEAKKNPEEPRHVTETENDNDITNAESLDLNVSPDAVDVNEAGDENQEQQSPDKITESSNIDKIVSKDVKTDFLALDDQTDSSNNDNIVSKDVTTDSMALDNPTDSETDVQNSGDEIAIKEPKTPIKVKAAPLKTSDEINPDNTEASGQNDPQASDTDVPCSSSETEVKKEPGMAEADVKKEPQSPDGDNNQKQPDAAQPGTSKDQPGAAGPSNDGAAPNNLRARERCLYGAHCYRKNPQHKVEFSHPSDADYGAEEQAQCPYGAQCHRTDPRHWQAHRHPAGTLPPQQSRHGIRVVQRRGQFFYINAHAVHFHDNHYAVEDEDGQRVDYDYEF